LAQEEEAKKLEDEVEKINRERQEWNKKRVEKQILKDVKSFQKEKVEGCLFFYQELTSFVGSDAKVSYKQAPQNLENQPAKASSYCTSDSNLIKLAEKQRWE